MVAAQRFVGGADARNSARRDAGKGKGKGKGTGEKGKAKKATALAVRKRPAGALGEMRTYRRVSECIWTVQKKGSNFWKQLAQVSDKTIMSRIGGERGPSDIGEELVQTTMERMLEEGWTHQTRARPSKNPPSPS